jgi:hypothetical protein
VQVCGMASQLTDSDEELGNQEAIKSTVEDLSATYAAVANISISIICSQNVVS